ncbi:unnamed protein product [Ectocarpus sp. 13 AM-2016]
MFNSWCSGYYAFDNNTVLADDLTDEDNTCQELGECSQCGANCRSLRIDYTDWLFDLEDDPREMNNLANEHPEVVESLRRRVLEVVFQEFSNSSYESVNYGAYYIWRKFDYWMVPWWELEQGADGDESVGCSFLDYCLSVLLLDLFWSCVYPFSCACVRRRGWLHRS